MDREITITASDEEIRAVAATIATDKDPGDYSQRGMLLYRFQVACLELVRQQDAADAVGAEEPLAHPDGLEAQGVAVIDGSVGFDQVERRADDTGPGGSSE